jgi:hypothetical protein
MSHAYVTSESGVRELAIYYGIKEVSFDDERFFPFGEQLVSRSSFVAEEATAWGPGYAWDEIKPMLEALVTEGILKSGDAVDDPRGGGLVPSRLAPSVCPVPRAWTAEDCESITRDIAGRSVEIGNLEAILSVYRIPHPALDADGRQVGEANVFPPMLRLDRETEWRVCQYSGSRYRDDRPMNVTALKAMIKYWKPMMAAILEIRAELRTRLSRGGDGWTVGDLHMFSGVALAVPAYWLMKGGASGGRPLHPVLSSMFRITDGIRMTTHEMIFLSEERTRDPGEMVTASELYGFAERNGTFLAGHGVCAGPRAMIDEFFTTVFDGTPLPGGDSLVQAPEVRALLDELPDAVEYGLLGLQSWSVARSVWLAMSRANKALRQVFAATGEAAGLCRRIRERLDEDWPRLDQQKIASDYERDVHLTVYADLYEHARRAMRTPLGPATLAERIDPDHKGLDRAGPRPDAPMHVAAAARLRQILGERFAATELAGTPAIEQIVGILTLYLREEQAILASSREIQAAINERLGRPQPRRALTARDLRSVYAMYGGSIAKFPYLFDTLEDELGLRVECTADSIEVTDEVTDRKAGRAEPGPAHSAAISTGLQ